MNEHASPRWLNIIVGIWVALSAFFWPHSPAEFKNTLIVGALSAAFAALALKVQAFRIVNVLLALWLFVTTWAFPVASRGTLWNNVIAAIVMLAIALIPPTTTPAMARR